VRSAASFGKSMLNGPGANFPVHAAYQGVPVLQVQSHSSRPEVRQPQLARGKRLVIPTHVFDFDGLSI
jgi:hypothetical protein